MLCRPLQFWFKEKMGKSALFIGQVNVIVNLVMLVVQVFQLLMLVLVMQMSVVRADTFGC